MTIQDDPMSTQQQTREATDAMDGDERPWKSPIWIAGMIAAALIVAFMG